MQDLCFAFARILAHTGFVRVVASLAMLSAFVTAEAHHSPANFDTKQTVTINGTVSRIRWFNPHVYIYVESTTDEKKVEWEIECFPPIALQGFGWTKESLRTGDQVTVTGNPGKNPNLREIYPSVIKKGDGILFSMQDAPKRLLSAAAPVPADTGAKSLAGTWATVLSVPLLMQTSFPEPAKLTKEGQDALKRSDEKTGPSTECIASTAPLSMITPDLKRISMDSKAIYIEGESEGTRRVIHLDAASHADAIPSFQGHSMGRWDGKTLVVDTARFAYHGMGHGGGNGIAPQLPSSTQKHLIEWFALNDDGKVLTYRFELSDPVFLSEPRSASVQLVYKPTARFETYPCSLESAKHFLRTNRIDAR